MLGVSDLFRSPYAPRLAMPLLVLATPRTAVANLFDAPLFQRDPMVRFSFAVLHLPSKALLYLRGADDACLCRRITGHYWALLCFTIAVRFFAIPLPVFSERRFTKPWRLRSKHIFAFAFHIVSKLFLCLYALSCAIP